jgi:DNA repair exonuclease SbcCD ATPase subunit
VSQCKSDIPALAAVAEDLDAELCRYETLATGIQRERLNSEKDLRQAVRALRDLEDSEAQLGQHLQTLVAAIGAARERQEKQSLAVRERAEQIRRRTAGLTELLTRWGALGEAAGEVNRLVQQVAATIQKAGAEEQLDAAAFREVDDRLGRLAEDSQDLAQAAQAEAFVDLGRQAESLRQQLLSARNKFRILERRRGSAGEP